MMVSIAVLLGKFRVNPSLAQNLEKVQLAFCWRCGIITAPRCLDGKIRENREEIHGLAAVRGEPGCHVPLGDWEGAAGR